MRGRQKGQTKRMSVIKDPIIAPYEIQVEEDQYVLIPVEQDEIKTAIDGFNATIQAAASSAGMAFVNANSIFQQTKTTINGVVKQMIHLFCKANNFITTNVINC